jgi:hypothetical protein
MSTGLPVEVIETPPAKAEMEIRPTPALFAVAVAAEGFQRPVKVAAPAEVGQGLSGATAVALARLRQLARPRRAEVLALVVSSLSPVEAGSPLPGEGAVAPAWVS